MLTSSYRAANTDAPLAHITIGDALRQAAQACPDRIALIDGQPLAAARQRWSYAELLDTAERIARAIRRHADPGERVVLYAGNSAEWMILFYAVALSGCVLVPANPGYTAGELKHIVTSSRAVLIVHAEQHRGRDLAPVVESVAGEAPDLRHAIKLTALIAMIDAPGAIGAAETIDPRATVLVQYTSGTTGQPKGACLDHLGLVNSTRFVGLRAGLPEGDVWICPMPLFHVGASVTSGVGTLMRRGGLIVMAEFDPPAMLRLVEEERANTALLVPTMIAALLEANARDARDLSSFRTLFSGATTVPPALVDRARRELGCAFSILFGQTELSGNVSGTFASDAVLDQGETVGTPFPHVETRIVDRASGAILPIGEAGEICFRGYQVMQGYLDRREETRKVLDPDGWLRTGDVGSMDARGYLRISGRLKDVVIRGGMNVYPREVEEALLAHDAVADACVVGVEDERLGEIVAAVIQRRDGAALDPDALHAHCRARLAAYKTPALWFETSALPVTPTGKVQKFAVAAQIATGLLQPLSRSETLSLFSRGAR